MTTLTPEQALEQLETPMHSDEQKAAIRKAAAAATGFTNARIEPAELAERILTAVGFFDQPTIRKDDSDGLVERNKAFLAEHTTGDPDDDCLEHHLLRLSTDCITALEQQLAEAREEIARWECRFGDSQPQEQQG